VISPPEPEALPYSAVINASEATIEASEPANPCGKTGSPNGSIWYEFTPVDSGRYQFDTLSSNYDTILTIWTSATGSLTDMVNVDCSDDLNRDWSSRIRQGLDAGVTYYVRVSAAGSPGANSVLNLSVILTGDAGGPYTVIEGDSLTLAADSATREGTVSYSWDVNGDGVFGDATGQNPTLTWNQLTALGISDDPGTYTVRVEVFNGNNTQRSAPTTLTVIGAEELLAQLRADTITYVTNPTTERALVATLDKVRLAMQQGNPFSAYFAILQYIVQLDRAVDTRAISGANAMTLIAQARVVLDAMM
jgi:hypothetical protein